MDARAKCAAEPGARIAPGDRRWRFRGLLPAGGQSRGRQDLVLRGAAALAPPERGMISPAEFIPVAEDTGLINELGQFVLRDGVRRGGELAGRMSASRSTSRRSSSRARRWRSTSPRRLRRPGSPPSRLELEITEAVLIRDDEAALEVLHQLRALGVRIALDDFGTGYSSLSYLQRFPVRQDQDRPLLRQGHGRRGRVVGDRPGGGQHRRRPAT